MIMKAYFVFLIIAGVFLAFFTVRGLLVRSSSTGRRLTSRRNTVLRGLGIRWLRGSLSGLSVGGSTSFRGFHILGG